MWDFLWYTSGKRAFSFSQGTLEMTGAGVGARASRTALKIYCKSSSEYLGILVAAAGDFSPWGLLGCSENSDLGGRKEPGGATEGAIERRSRQGRLRPQTEIILAQAFF